MKRHVPFAFAALLFLAGCGDDTPTTPPGTLPDGYREPLAPEDALYDLQVAWRRKDPDPYALLLRHDFRFFFQEDDARQIGTDSWTRDDDATATRSLFAAEDIRDIRIDLTALPTKTPPEELGFPEGTMWIRVGPTALEVDQYPDLTLVVDGDIQDFYFLKGDPAEGENPDWWYLLEWRDRGGFLGRGKPAVETISWGLIKALYWQVSPAPHLDTPPPRY